MTETFYEVLGVAEDATTDEIESAYRERLKQTHPDVSDDDDAERATQRLIEARDVLVDDAERERYDRVGHDTYVGEGAVPTEPSPTERDSGGANGASKAERTTETTAPGSGSQGDRTSRERRARQRVSADRRQSRTDSSEAGATGGARTPGDATGTSTASSADSASTTAATSGRRRPGKHVRAEAADESEVQYSVREDVSTPTSYGPLLPSGHRLTLLGIFLALYPVLLFSALLPAFPLLVNLVIGFCLVMTIGYLQSMPRVGLLVFGTWSFVAVFLVLITNIGFLSLAGVAMLSGTLLPLALSTLTASALRY